MMMQEIKINLFQLKNSEFNAPVKKTNPYRNFFTIICVPALDIKSNNI